METHTVPYPEGFEYGAGDDEFVIASESGEGYRRAIVKVSCEAPDEESAEEFMEEIREAVSGVEEIVPKKDTHPPKNEEE